MTMRRKRSGFPLHQHRHKPTKMPGVSNYLVHKLKTTKNAGVAFSDHQEIQKEFDGKKDGKNESMPALNYLEQPLARLRLLSTPVTLFPTPEVDGK